MASQKNITSLEEIKQRLEKAQAVFLVDYTGLTHMQLEDFRHELATVKAEVVILKNTLVNIAFKDKKIDVTEKLKGPHAVIFANEDPIGAARVIVAFNKKNSLPIIKFGIFENNIIEEGMVTTLSSIPPKEVLLSKLLGLLNSPITSLVYDLNFNIQKLAILLKEVEKKKVDTDVS
ncbi:MAG: 50S ribosomal protein L10 [Candidatus Levybacteria bacterium CG_4_10_14_0_2_um_filter_36_16]|nr:MAG: 50S ribosomal protein L10 [Candidatus Levybacteria bacterium CG2_30_37_29]PIR79629.1 MAG: 50S ribosomal protein L10 [Candidatus Levybacteria bacterium CG10_big_fil_rev_8_21_14_0_10_36_30]PIZ96715.1 MAG: 50S ribosomal protein L10 [Candidatus Levybacteria bacterium CG_4_10_14_0_2_um_filter_36_16]PJA90750.1 MAG: 50S ribosomal protein L10 [Candidatus Levybacteria bacterium CG_4_9_14_3_um_filter_36_7]